MAAMVLCMVLAQATTAPESTHRILADESIFGLVAYKAGFAAGLIDNNLTYARAYTARFVYGARPEEAAFDLHLDAKSMGVNDYAVQTRWFPRFKELGILDTPFKETSVWRQRKMSQTTMSERLLDAEHYPFVEARTVSVTKEATGSGEERYRLGLEITIRGKTEHVEWPATFVRDGEKIIVETHGALKFTTFGIDPYSRLFGAIRYRDDFRIFVHMVAVPIEKPAP